MTVLYTPGQLRNAVAIPQETYRHWKKALAPFARGRGHSPCFSSGDMVAAAVIRLLAIDLSVRVSGLAPIASALFELCNASPWPVLERTKILISLNEPSVRLVAELGDALSDHPLVIVPLRAVVAQLREQLLAATDHEEQPALRFPPTPIGSSVAARRARM